MENCLKKAPGARMADFIASESKTLIFVSSYIIRLPASLLGIDSPVIRFGNLYLCPMYLFFDTETTGLPISWKAKVSDVDNWPRLVQIAWISTTENGVPISEVSHIVRPDGFVVPEESSEVHGISHAQALAEGQDLRDVLRQFAEAVTASQFVVGHNIAYDENIVGAEFIRTGIPHHLWERERICTKIESTDYLQLPGSFGFKWPTLAELHHFLFGEDFPNAHDALGDVKATLRCFFELKARDVI